MTFGPNVLHYSTVTFITFLSLYNILYPGELETTNVLPLNHRNISSLSLLTSLFREEDTDSLQTLWYFIKLQGTSQIKCK